MAKEPRLTAEVLRVLSAVAGEELSGAQIAKITSLASGSLYPILLRLEKAGWLASRWEDGDPSELGRPRRRFYTMTALGSARARSAARSLTNAVGRLAWT
ncbi:MAG: helix-turn-helix transcriptional regulator [Proteobacteria bacterium]|nr:helix-turn-helix transcriptional regulator [Pseudomonadota bacterium]